MRTATALLCMLVAGCGGRSGAPADGAAADGEVEVWSTTDAPAVAGLLADFRAVHPGIRVRYREMKAQPVHRLIEERSRSGGPVPDVVWSSAMDLQTKLVNDGVALRYTSPERLALPDWADWKDEAWGTTAEPIVIVYNRALLDPALAPRSHAELLRLLERRLPRLRGRIATYDIANSAVGYLLLSQDEGASRLAWPLVRALGANRARLFASSEAIISDVSAGRSVIGYNVVGSYAIAETRRNPDLAVVLPKDYTLLASRIAVIPERAAHPAAARAFLDYLLSRRGQNHLVAGAMPSVRRDMAMPDYLHVPEQVRRAIRIGPALLVIQDGLTRRRFLEEWRKAMTTGGRDPARSASAPARAGDGRGA